MRRLRVPDGRRRARVAHAPKAANDEARVFAEGGHPPRPAKAITNVPTQATGSAQMQYCAVVDGGNFVRLGRFHSTCTSAKIHLEAQESIIMSKLGAISSVKYGCEISVSKFVNFESFQRICTIRNIVLVTSMYKFTESHPNHSHKQLDSVNAAFKISKHLKRLCKYFLSGRWC